MDAAMSGLPAASPWRPSLEPYLIPLDPTDKNWNAAMPPGGTSLRVPLEDLSTPSLVVDVTAVEHNIVTMQGWMADSGLLFAPHGKTTMCPGLWSWQLDAGAWAITLANEFQLRVARAFGVPRVVIANEYLSPHGLVWLANEINNDDAFEVICWVDSVNAVDQMTAVLTEAGACRPVGVCVELGAMAARTGARTTETARAVAEAALRSPALTLLGISGYEGSVPSNTDVHLNPPRSSMMGVDRKEIAVRSFLSLMTTTFLDFIDLFETNAPILSAGGSSFFDLVQEEFTRVRDLVPSARLVVRSGSYIVHDDGTYQITTPAASRSGPDFVPAAHIWSRVLSLPQPGLALLDVGKRDVPYDMDLPVILEVRRGPKGNGASVLGVVSTITGLDDQHAYVSFDTDNPLEVGDVIKLGLSHPCTVFDKWRSLLLLEDDEHSQPIVRGALRTYF